MPSYKKKQVGGASDFMSSFYATGAVGGPPAISQATLAGINNAPMFNPLSSSAVVPGGTSLGIVPSGLYLSGMQVGGAKGLTVAKLRTLCNARGLSCKDSKGKYLLKSKLLKLLEGGH